MRKGNRWSRKFMSTLAGATCFFFGATCLGTGLSLIGYAVLPLEGLLLSGVAILWFVLGENFYQISDSKKSLLSHLLPED